MFLGDLQVQKTNPRVANLQVVCVGQRPVQGTFSAILRCPKLRHAGLGTSLCLALMELADAHACAAGVRTSEPQRSTRYACQLHVLRDLRFCTHLREPLSAGRFVRLLPSG